MFFSDDAGGFVNLAEAVPDVLLDIRYYSTYNFIGDRIDGYEEPVALLAREADDGKIKFSLRAKEPDLISDVAQMFGGGGHPQTHRGKRAAALRGKGIPDFGQPGCMLPGGQGADLAG